MCDFLPIINYSNQHEVLICVTPPQKEPLFQWALSQARALLCPGFFVPLDQVFLNMAKIHFRPYTTKQILLFPQRIDENIAEDDPVRLVNGLIDQLDLTSFRKLYKEYGRSPFHPRMMLKAVIYGYLSNLAYLEQLRH